jgi:hypothetical protein
LFCFDLLTFVFIIKHHPQPPHDHLTTKVALLAFVFLRFVLDSISSPAWFCLTQSVSSSLAGLFLPLTFMAAVISKTNI